MCDVCKRKHGDIAAALEKFLGDGFGVTFNPDKDGWQDLEIHRLHTGKRFKLTADGDEGGYFHYEPPQMSVEEAAQILNKDLSSQQKAALEILVNAAKVTA